MICWSNSHQIQPLIAGFQTLHRKGVIQLDQELDRGGYIDPDAPPHLRDMRYSQMRVIVNDTLDLYYDNHDSQYFYQPALEKADFYFKRSYIKKFAQESKEFAKIHPLGLLLRVVADRPDRWALERLRLPIEKYDLPLLLSSLLNLDRISPRLGMIPRAETFGRYPDFQAPLRVIFQVRAWEPEKARSNEMAEDRANVNEMRAGCIRALRKNFGERFIGGFRITPFTVAKYPDCLIESNTFYRLDQYYKLLKEIPISIANNGLQYSVGMKMSEYVAFSKAIVSEATQASFPGDFTEGKNYLSFQTPDECIEAVTRLFEQREFRQEMMLRNFAYYQTNLRPDMLVLNSLAICLKDNKAAAL